MGFKSFEVEKSQACKFVCSDLMANPLLDDFILVSAVLYVNMHINGVFSLKTELGIYPSDISIIAIC